MDGGYSIVDVSTIDPEPSAGSGTLNVDLGRELGCTEMRPRVWYLSPGDAMSYHRQTEQEELYYALRGPGQIRIDGEVVDVPEGAAVRIPPETPRQVRNETQDEHVWLIIGAPPTPDDHELVG